MLLHFWTFACINCQHALQSLATIERELEGEPLLIISVHSPKFPAQREVELATEAVRQLEVTHPVVLDPDSRITHSFAVSGWPTMVFVGPAGTILGTLRGEPEPQGLLNVVRQVLAAGKADGSLTGGPLPLKPDRAPPHRLAFPEAVLCAEVAGEPRVIVADSGHHQVVICDTAGAELLRIGTGAPGLADGPAAEAELRRPCGLAVVHQPEGDILYIADTGNHALRAVDLQANLVTTLAGGPGQSTAPPLRSPWGLAWSGSRLYLAAAGSHQLWAFDPATSHLAVIAGTGAEGGKDGPATEAYFAQPSGLAFSGGPVGHSGHGGHGGHRALYVVDAETSSIRAIDGLDDPGRARLGGAGTRTVCGAGDLFGFGDRDGAGPGAELQHPIGLTGGPDGTLWVADTFNHKIKRVDPSTGSCRTAFGNGDSLLDEASPAGTVLGPAGPDRPLFCVPEGVAAGPDGRSLLVADTGNHRIVSVPLDQGGGPATVLIGGPAGQRDRR
ncbi:MAG TPA: alkyl hydroperoxide reductase [Acidimicrobiia bacterium]|nr:alkyl hydroperoxide reductase [Acidimicrobiia bacterium]